MEWIFDISHGYPQILYLPFSYGNVVNIDQHMYVCIASGKVADSCAVPADILPLKVWRIKIADKRDAYIWLIRMCTNLTSLIYLHIQAHHPSILLQKQKIKITVPTYVIETDV